jgi:protein TonB
MTSSITATDRLIFTLIFSIIINLTIVLGVSFDVESPPTNKPVANLEVTLVKQQTLEQPEKADYLAQVNNEGGGETEEKSPEPSPEVAEVIDNEQPTQATQISPAVVPVTVPVEPPMEHPVIDPPVVAEPEVKQEIKTPPQKKNDTPKKVITQQKAERKVVTAIEEIKTAVPEEKPQPPRPSARELMYSAQSEIARLEREFEMSRSALSKRPKKRRISASTKEFAAAAYIKAWASKVERIGNFNYPQEAKRQGLNGSLMLSVDINPDGSVPPNGIVISRSSGYKVLDDAAIKIVRLGAPYAVIPEDVLLDNDMLTITRTWKFETNRGLSAR